MEGIGIALNLRGNRMFMTDFGGSLYSAKLDGTETNIAPCPGKPDRHCIRRIPLKGGLTMYYNKPIGRIAIVGTGLVGASWAAQYLARGFDVVATDPAPDAQMNLRGYIDESWKALTSLGLSAGASRDRLSFTKDMKEALTKADFVQENGPERPDSKIKLFADMDEMTPSDSIIASSSSGLTMSFIQAKCTHPERCLIGHPFNPPHILPLVEVVGGSKTSQAAIKQAMRFYKSIGKKPILLRREVPGHVANRLQSALYREVLYLIEQGVVSAADADDAVSWGPGLRWGVMGPSLQFHVGGGAGGIEHFMNHLFDPMVTLFKALGNPDITPNLKQTIAEGFVQEAADRCGGAREPRKRDTHRAS
jgi:3-hydroxyacyl-CoA dehydrogenase